MSRNTPKKEALRPRCQCDPSCKNMPLPRLPFCKKHIYTCNKKSPLTGYEPAYNPSRYNKTRRIRNSHNCFAYAFDYMEVPSEKECNEKYCNTRFHQPGIQSGYPKWRHVKMKQCPDLVSRLRGDIPGIINTTFEEKCPPHTSKIALVVDPKEDYHFYRQDKNGLWSHKPGATHVTNLDATKRLIYNPELASRYYDNGRLDYSSFCTYMCAPKTKTFKFKRGGRRRSRSSSRTHKRT